jgi:hypothetical protein
MAKWETMILENTDDHIQVKLDDYLYQISSLIAEVRHHKERILILEQCLLHREENK